MRWSLLLCAALLAGCAAPTPGFGGGPGHDTAPLRFTVLDAWVDAGRCFDGAEAFGDVCHRLRVEIDNQGNPNRIATNPLQWSAEDQDGRIARSPSSDADEVGADRVSTITLGFTSKPHSPRLAQLHYDGFAAKGSAPVPGY